MSSGLVFLKLGGSLITDKDKPHTPRLEVMQRLAGEIATALAQEPGLQVLLGHGSGSFGHVPASKYKTRLGVQTAEEWRGFIEVWQQAAELKHLVLEACKKAHLPALVFSPSAMVIANHGKVKRWNLDPLQAALKRGILPVIHGDVVFDEALGGTILSTEDLFGYLVRVLQPSRLLFAGDEPGVWEDFPHNTRLLAEITPQSLPQVKRNLGGSTATDVTGGMADKVNQIIAMLVGSPGLSASIFSGAVEGNLRRALSGEPMGTEIHN